MRSLRMMLNLMNELEQMTTMSSSLLSPARQSLFNQRLPKWDLYLDDHPWYAIENKPKKDDFQLSIDVKHFKPEELKVKVVDDCVVVEGKQEERAGGNKYYSHEFVRRYALPKDYDVERVVSTLSPEGVLTVSVSKPPEIESKARNEHHIPIQQTGEKKSDAADDKRETKASSGSSEQ